MYGATAGRVGLLKIDAAVNQAVCALVLDEDRADPTFVFHALRSLGDSLASKAAGAAQQNLNAGLIRSFRLTMPRADTQRHIGAVLAAFDELIAINERRVELLEDLARSLYREWIVRFRFPGHDVTSRADSLPAGWERRPSSGAATFINGYAFKPTDWGTSGPPIIKIKELRQGVSTSTPRYSGSHLPAKYEVQRGDLLFSWSAHLGVYLWPDEPGYLNQHLFKVTPVDGLTVEYLFHALEAAMPDFDARAQGTTMRHIKRAALTEVELVIPASHVLDAFTETVAPVHERVLVLSHANAALARTRDLLLPRLVSGRLDISDIDLGNLLPAETPA